MLDIQLISECRRSISLEIGRVLLSPQEFPIDILLSLLAALDVAGEEAEALRFREQVTARLVISSMRYSGRQRLIVFVTGRGGAGFHFGPPPLRWPEVSSLPFLPALYDKGPWAGCEAARVFYFPR